MKKIVVLASGEGSNFSAIVESGITVDMLITDNKNANVIKRAKKADVPVFVFDRKEGDYKNGHGWSDGKIDETIPEDVSLIVLAGYMRIIPPVYIKKKKWQNNPTLRLRMNALARACSTHLEQPDNPKE